MDMSEQQPGQESFRGLYLDQFPYLTYREISPDHEDNALLADRLLPGPHDEQHAAVVELSASVLDTVGDLYGRHPGEVGRWYRENPWDQHSAPLFYHNLLGTKLAALNAYRVENFVDSAAVEAGREPVFAGNPRRRSISRLAACADDLIFAKFGRDADEDASAWLIGEAMQQYPVLDDLQEGVGVTVEASKINVATGKQSLNPGKGYAPEQIVTTDGDLLAASMPQSTVLVMALGVEYGWLADSPTENKGVLFRAVQEERWQGRNLYDFFEFMQGREDTKQALADFLINNPTFLSSHSYTAEGLNGRMSYGKQQNMVLQPLLGKAIKDGGLTIQDAFNCALSFGSARDGEPFTMFMPGTLPPWHQVADIIMGGDDIDSIPDPVNAEDFFGRYMNIARSHQAGMGQKL